MKKDERISDRRWIARNFAALIDEFGGRCVAVVHGRVVAVGVCTDRVERSARRSTGAVVPAVLRVPLKGKFGLSSFRLLGFS